MKPVDSEPFDSKSDDDLTTEAPAVEIHRENQDTVFGFLKELPVLIITAVIVAWIVKTFIIQPFIIPSGSMEPTLYPSDRILVNKFIYRLREPRPGEIVVFLPPFDSKKDVIKRVIALSGQTLEIRNGEVMVDGKVIDESYKIASADMGDFGPLVIPKGSVFVMGDNRPNSYDSRFFGPLKKNVLIGEAFSIYWPPTRIQILH